MLCVMPHTDINTWHKCSNICLHTWWRIFETCGFSWKTHIIQGGKNAECTWIVLPLTGVGVPFKSWFRCCCLIWLREGRGWGPAVSVSLAQSSTSLCKSSVNVCFLLLLLLVWAWASVVNGWGSGTGMATGDRADWWLDAELAEVVPLQCDDPVRERERERTPYKLRIKTKKNRNE